MIFKAVFSPRKVSTSSWMYSTPHNFSPGSYHGHAHFHQGVFKDSPWLDYLLACELYQRHVTFAQWIMGNHELCTLLKGGQQGPTSRRYGLL